MKISAALILAVVFCAGCSQVEVLTEEVNHGVVLEKNLYKNDPDNGYLLVKFDQPVVEGEYIASCMVSKETYDKMKVGSKYNLVVKKRNGKVIRIYFVAEP